MAICIHKMMIMLSMVTYFSSHTANAAITKPYQSFENSPPKKAIPNKIEYKLGTCYDGMEEECIDLDDIIEHEIPFLVDQSYIKDEVDNKSSKKDKILELIDNLKVDLSNQKGKGSRLKKRPEQPDITNSTTSTTSEHEHEVKKSDPVLILSAVDGTLAGVSRSSGHILWKISRENYLKENSSVCDSSTSSSTVSSVSWNKFLSPLVSTTTKSTSTSLQWHAIPSIDGTVFLTTAKKVGTHDEQLSENSITTQIRDLVSETPFIDAHGRFYVGSRQAMVAAIDEQTGEILRIVPKWKGGKKRVMREDDGDDSNHQQEATSEDDIYDDDDDDDDVNLAPSFADRNVVWIGRIEYSVTVHDLHKGTVDVEFSVAEILSVDEIIHGNQRYDSSITLRGKRGNDNERKKDSNTEKYTPTSADEERTERLFTEYMIDALRHPNFGDRLLTLPAPSRFDEDKLKSTLEEKELNAEVGVSPFLVSTPGGNVAFRDPVSSLGWVSFNVLASPVVYAIEASTGQKIKVNIVPDSSAVSDSMQTSPESMMEDLPMRLQWHIAYLTQQSTSIMTEAVDDACDDNIQCHAMSIREQRDRVVGVLKDGQLYALPLGMQTSRQKIPLALPFPQSRVSNKVSVLEMPKTAGLNLFHSIRYHDDHDPAGEDIDAGDRRRIHINPINKHTCTPSSPVYPGCLIGASLMIGDKILDKNKIASVFEASDLDFDLYLDMLEGTNNNKKSMLFQKLMKIMSSWIAPIVALLFVVSFEIGRRERLKVEANNNVFDSSRTWNSSKDSSEFEKSNDSNQALIQLTNEILGYGSHGTIVYKGVLDKRQVAVKRLLSMYHSHAEREISLLIESDGHPNVVRYFLKEFRGDFIYLALELCDMSLNDLIVSLSKLKSAQDEKLHQLDAEGLEFATQRLLFQIASGVRHLHSLRIVHRDLKPQNILLAHKSRTRSASNNGEFSSKSETCTIYDTNYMLELFTHDQYVPKISDMGLGKQLASQSSFGFSTLGRGTIATGPDGNASHAGAGAGSVGWQAPEVMALRFSNEISSNGRDESMSDASAPDTSFHGRTSRSVDIFSLGCIFYCTSLYGSHPFGEWYEREANIMKNNPNKEGLKSLSPDASALISSMLSWDATSRPTASEVCEHPYFWSLSKRLKFLCELSDRIELCHSNLENANNEPSELNIFAIEKNALEIIGTSWEKKLDNELIEASLSRRTYDPSSVRDCLRMIRNKHHHYEELPMQLKSRIGSSTEGFSRYVSKKFPRLIIHCYNFCVANMKPDDSLVEEYRLPIPKRLPSDPIVMGELTEPFFHFGHIDDKFEKEVLDKNDEKNESFFSSRASTLDNESPDTPEESMDEELSEFTSQKISPEMEDFDNHRPLNDAASLENVSGIVVWYGSNIARQLNCRGWMRFEDEWVSRLDSNMRKRDPNLARCADDPKFRTRLCNYWDMSGGTYCPIEKKNKCIFAHGPVELRVKEGKRKRWGTLVNKNGECSNSKASGGEDTYGVARSIENSRKEEGQMNVDTARTPKRQQRPKGKSGSTKVNSCSDKKQRPKVIR